MNRRRQHTPTLHELAPDAPVEDMVYMAVFWEVLQGAAPLESIHGVVEANVGLPLDHELVSGIVEQVRQLRAQQGM